MTAVLNLDASVETILSPVAPFSFDGTFHKPSHYPTPDNHYITGTYWQTMRFEDYTYGLKFTNLGTTSNPNVLLTIFYDKSAGEPPNVSGIAKEVEFRFDLQADLSEFCDRFRQDEFLAPALERWQGMRVSTPYSFYEFMVVTTLLQNTVVRRTVQMMKNLFDAYGTLLNYDEHELYAFWSPKAIDETDESRLRELKLGYRAKTLKRQAHDFVSGVIDLEAFRYLTTDSLKSNLLKVYGIGPATVEYIIFEVFHRYNISDHIPPWEQKIYSRLLFNKELVDTIIILCALNERYREWKTLAVHYLFEDLFWLRKNQSIPWLEELIRL